MLLLFILCSWLLLMGIRENNLFWSKDSKLMFLFVLWWWIPTRQTTERSLFTSWASLSEISLQCGKMSCLPFSKTKACFCRSCMISCCCCRIPLQFPTLSGSFRHISSGAPHHSWPCEGMQQIGLQLVTIEEDSGWDNAQKWTWEAHNLGKKRQFVAAAASPTRIFNSSHQGWGTHLGCAFDIVLHIYTTVFMFLLKSINDTLLLELLILLKEPSACYELG